MKIISWNINGVRAITKKDFFGDFSKMDPDIICFQETKAQDDEVKTALSKITHYHQYYNSAARKGYSGGNVRHGRCGTRQRRPCNLFGI